MSIIGTAENHPGDAFTGPFDLADVPTSNGQQNLHWFKNTAPQGESFRVYVVKLKERINADTVTCAFIDTQTGAAYPNPSVDIDLTAGGIWRYLPSTIDSAEEGHHAYLCVTDGAIAELASHASTSYIGKFPYGADDLMRSVLMRLLADRTLRDAALTILRHVLADEVLMKSTLRALERGDP
jgi:hypothetical protein